MDQFNRFTLLDKKYVSHSADGMSFALAYYEREDKSCFFVLVKEYRPSTLVNCAKCGPYVYENAAAISIEALKSIQRELERLTKQFHKETPHYGTLYYHITVKHKL
jgi:hypothetical protein